MIARESFSTVVLQARIGPSSFQHFRTCHPPVDYCGDRTKHLLQVIKGDRKRPSISLSTTLCFIPTLTFCLLSHFQCAFSALWPPLCWCNGIVQNQTKSDTWLILNRQIQLEELPVEAGKCSEWAISDIEVSSKKSCVWIDWDHYGWRVEDGGRGREKSNNSLRFSSWLSLSSDTEWYSDTVYIIIYSRGILIGPVR